MWDPRYGDLAALRLAEAHAEAAQSREVAATSRSGRRTRRLRRAVGARLVSWGERLAAPKTAIPV